MFSMATTTVTKAAESAMRLIDLQPEDEPPISEEVDKKSRRTKLLQGFVVFGIMFIVLYWGLSRRSD